MNDARPCLLNVQARLVSSFSVELIIFCLYHHLLLVAEFC
jgi:hypothetical protein